MNYPQTDIAGKRLISISMKLLKRCLRRVEERRFYRRILLRIQVTTYLTEEYLRRNIQPKYGQCLTLPASQEPTPDSGLLGDKSEDVLFCDNSLVEILPDTITKRVILSYVNRDFDSISFTCPFS
ncbi:hypothetical protein TNCV_950501 [Trichonephila clavipes]|nr:hypothetical protein TNCV_950501 [Trichonephila clavipes]